VWTRRPRSRRWSAPNRSPGGASTVERRTHDIERQALRRGEVASVAELVAATGRFVGAWNERCQPFRWVKDADQILGGLTGQPLRL
jgi:hypothetical protein